METVYDWVSLAVFGGLIVLFLERSSMPDPPDRVWHYLPPAVGCAAANYAGNEGSPLVAVLLLVGVLAYVAYVLKPWVRG